MAQANSDTTTLKRHFITKVKKEKITKKIAYRN